MKPIVLVHGSWLGAWCWQDVISALKSHGATVSAPDLPAHGEDPGSIADASIDAYANRVIQTIESLPGPVVLAGHSMAGAVITTVAERIPDRIAHLVYIAAYLLEDGQSLMQASELAPGSEVPPNMVFAPDYSSVTIKPENLAAIFADDASPEQKALLLAKSRPEPAAPFGMPVHTSAANFGRVPKAYIRTSQDRVIPPALQDAMLARTPIATVDTLPASHSPYFSQAHPLAHLILRFA